MFQIFCMISTTKKDKYKLHEMYMDVTVLYHKLCVLETINLHCALFDPITALVCVFL